MGSCRLEVSGVGTTRTKWLIWDLKGLATSTADEQVEHAICVASVWLVLGLIEISGLSLGNPSLLFQLPRHFWLS